MAKKKKGQDGGRPWLWRAGPKQGRGEVWVVGGANAQDPQGWKRPWGLWGVRLRLKEQKGHRCAPHLWSQRAGDLTWEPSSLPVPEWAGQSPSIPLLLLLGWLLPPATPDLPSLPPMPPGPTLAGWGFGVGGTGLGAQQAPQPMWARRSPSALLPLFPQGPSHLPLLISLASGSLILSGLHFSFPPQSPYVLPVHSRVPPVSLGVRVPHQRPAGALVVGRR